MSFRLTVIVIATGFVLAFTSRPAGKTIEPDLSLMTSHRNGLPEADDPFRAADRLPDRGQLDRQHDDGGQQRDREQEPVLLEIASEIRAIARAGTTLSGG